MHNFFVGEKQSKCGDFQNPVNAAHAYIPLASSTTNGDLDLDLDSCKFTSEIEVNAISMTNELLMLQEHNAISSI